MSSEKPRSSRDEARHGSHENHEVLEGQEGDIFLPAGQGEGEEEEEGQIERERERDNAKTKSTGSTRCDSK